MITRLRRKLLLLFTLFIVLFFSIVTILYLSISYHALYEKSYMTFNQNSLSIYNMIQNNRILERERFACFTNDSYDIYLSDKNGLLAFESQNPLSNPDTAYAEIIKQAASEKMIADSIYKYKTFEYKDVTGQKYFTSLFYCSPYENNYFQDVSVVILNSKEQFQEQFLALVIKYAFISVICILLLCVFSFFFIQKVLAPIAIYTERQKQFIASASHELRTPLTLIKSNLLAMRKAHGDHADKYYQIIDSECTRMSSLLGNLLTLSRIDGQRWSVKLEPHHIEPILFQCYNNFEEIALKKGIALLIDLPDDPIPTHPIDKNQILQLLTILVDNACHYTNHGSITLRSYKQKNQLFLVVSDTGVGIPDEQKERVFDRFYQVNTSHSNPDHFGLGLSIAKEIVTLHNGAITITDTPGGGTTFTITLR